MFSKFYNEEEANSREESGSSTCGVMIGDLKIDSLISSEHKPGFIGFSMNPLHKMPDGQLDTCTRVFTWIDETTLIAALRDLGFVRPC